MDNVRRNLLSIGLIGFTAACRQPIVTAAELRALRTLEIDSAEADARKAVAAGDWRLLSVGGFAKTLPGTELIDTNRERFIEGTGDMVDGEEHSRLITRAREYAKRYNREIIRLGGYTAPERAEIQKRSLNTQDGAPN